MKKVTIRGAERFEKLENFNKMERVIIAEGEELVCSDGYHTFDELYDHRITLFIALCRTLFNPALPAREIWCSKLHSDGKGYDGWFILGINKEWGKQITYHLPIKCWEEVTAFAEILETAPQWDGHTAEDVLERLKTL